MEAVANTFAQKLESKWLRIMVVVVDDDDGCCWSLLAALVLGPGVPWLAALLWLFLAVVGCCCWWLFAGPGRLWLFLAISGRHGSGLCFLGSPLYLGCCCLLLPEMARK